MNKDAYHRAAKRFGTPLYVYEQAVIERQCRRLKRLFPGIAFFYAMKANSNPALLKLLKREGMGAEAVSLGELSLARKAGFVPKEIRFTCSSLEEEELVLAARANVVVHLDSLHQLEVWGKRRLGGEVSLRLNQGIGAGHHAHVITGGPASKFGITLDDLPEAKRIAGRHGLVITGIQQHIGSNVLDADVLLRSARALLKTARGFPELTHIDFGGGLGIPYAPEEVPLDLARVGKELRMLMREFCRARGASISFGMEPGRFVVAESGSLLVTVVDAKKTSERRFVGVNSGFNHLVRHAMYGSYHPIEPLVRRGGALANMTIAGNICESGDLFAVDRPLPPLEAGDVLVIRNAGAYGFSMASVFNMRALPREVLVPSDGRLRDISFDPIAFALPSAG